jgi:hypothetical protein
MFSNVENNLEKLNLLYWFVLETEECGKIIDLKVVLGMSW